MCLDQPTVAPASRLETIRMTRFVFFFLGSTLGLLIFFKKYEKEKDIVNNRRRKTPISDAIFAQAGTFFLSSCKYLYRTHTYFY